MKKYMNGRFQSFVTTTSGRPARRLAVQNRARVGPVGDSRAIAAA